MTKKVEVSNELEVSRSIEKSILLMSMMMMLMLMMIMMKMKMMIMMLERMMKKEKDNK